MERCISMVDSSPCLQVAVSHCVEGGPTGACKLPRKFCLNSARDTGGGYKRVHLTLIH